jgi:hypothetical protein
VKVIVCGSRTWTDREAIRDQLRALPPGTTIVHGRSPGGGTDLIADEEARKLGHTVIPVPISNDDRARARSKRQAPILRNVRMFTEHSDATQTLAFWIGASPGTKHAIGESRRHGIPVTIIRPA